MCELRGKSTVFPLHSSRNMLHARELPPNTALVNILFTTFNLFFLRNPRANDEYGAVFRARQGGCAHRGNPAGDTAVTDNESAQLWSEASRRLQAVLPSDIYARWIEVIQPAGFTDGTLMLAVDNDFYQSWLEEHYLPMIRDAVASVHELSLIHI